LTLLIEQITCDAAAGEITISFRPAGVRSLAGQDARRTA
jgi:hypothetical protein